ncbi:MAG: ABC transporter permease subunit [Chloroflexota bacterium]|nr:ABC transporter permease subunit [Chloroflexota bacterium]
MTLLRIALRAQRTGLLATAWIGAVAGIANGVGYAAVAGTTHAERVAFAQQMELLGKQLSYLLPPPVALDTMGGYLSWRSFPTLAIVFAVWGLLAATGAGRGDEERGLTEAWLATGVSRMRWLATRTLAFVAAAAASLAIGCGVTAVAVAIVGDAVPAGAMAFAGMLLLGVALWSYGLGLLTAQLATTRRAASVIGGAIIVALYVINSVLRAGADPGPLKWLSPFYLFDRSTPLVPGGTVDPVATLLLVVIGVALAGLAAVAFERRDLGGALFRGRGGTTAPTVRPSSDPLLRLPVLASVDQQRWWIVGWAVGLAVLGYFLTSLARTIVDSLAAIPTMQLYLARAGINAYADIVGVIWFGTALLLISIFVVAQVNGWAADDAEGRLEASLAAGASRDRIVFERLAALLVAAGIVAVVSSGGVYLATRVFDISVRLDRLLIAALLVLPLVFAFGAIGHALVGWRPRVAVVILSGVAVVSYFVQQFAPVFDVPEWVSKLSLFVLYGTPLTKIEWSGPVTLTAIGIIGTALALGGMRRRDIGR